MKTSMKWTLLLAILALCLATTVQAEEPPSSSCALVSAAEAGPAPLFPMTMVSSIAPPPPPACFVSTDCEDGTSRSCSGSNCTGVDQNCAAGIRGYVTCDGVTSYCPTCAECVDGEQTPQVPAGCCSPTKQRYTWNVCVDGQWHSTSTCYGSCLEAE